MLIGALQIPRPVFFFPPFFWGGRGVRSIHVDIRTKVALISQSDFSLPAAPARDYAIPRKYDFTYSGSDQDVRNDCVGWSSFAKNWSFVVEVLLTSTSFWDHVRPRTSWLVPHKGARRAVCSC